MNLLFLELIKMLKIMLKFWVMPKSKDIIEENKEEVYLPGKKKKTEYISKFNIIIFHMYNLNK